MSMTDQENTPTDLLLAIARNLTTSMERVLADLEALRGEVGDLRGEVGDLRGQVVRLEAKVDHRMEQAELRVQGFQDAFHYAMTGIRADLRAIHRRLDDHERRIA